MWQSLKVVELASVLAGPLVGSFFAELGADVIKVENKRSNGDVTRNWKLKEENPGQSISAYYASANYGKKTCFLDLKDPKDYEVLIPMLQSADIVIQNFKTGDDVKLRLSPDILHDINPKLIIAKISGFGETSTRPAFDVVLQAESGFMSMNGNPSSGPVKMPVALIDVLAAHHLKEAILIALLERERTGNGKFVHVSLYDAALASLVNQANNWLMASQIPQAMGTQHPNIAPYGDMFTTQDGKQIVLAVGSDKQFSMLAQALGLDSRLSDKFSNNQNRVKNRTELNTILGEKISQLTCENLSTTFLDKNVPYGEIKDLEAVFALTQSKKMVLRSKIEGVECTSLRQVLQ